MNDDDFEIALARATIPIRGSIRAMVWVVVLMIVAIVGLAIHRDAGGWVALAAGVALIVITERHWQASASPQPIRLRGRLLELPSGMFLTRRSVVPVEALERLEMLGRGPGLRLLAESRERTEVYSVSDLVGGESAASQLRARVEAILARDAPERLARIRARAAAVGELRARPIRLTVALVVVLGLVFAAQLALFGEAAARPEALVRMGGNVGARVWAGEVWRLLAANLLHAGVEHLVGNVTALLVLGAVVERAVGGARFGAVLAISAVGGATLAAIANPPDIVSVGASTMAFGVMGCGWAVHLRRGWELPTDLRLRPRRLWIVLASQLVAHAMSPMAIDHWAHLGGLAAGFVSGWLIVRGESG